MTRMLLAMLAMATLSACAAQPVDKTRLALEDRACAELGIAPGDRAHATCTGNLDAALYNPDLPTGE